MSWRQNLHGKTQSRAEIDLWVEFQKRNLHPDTCRRICLSWTIPDFYWDLNRDTGFDGLLVYLDGTPVHKDFDRDDRILKQLQAMGYKVFRHAYDPPLSISRRIEIADSTEKWIKDGWKE